MYTFRFPMQFDKRFEIIAPGDTKYLMIHFGEMAYHACDVCSLHGIASGLVRVEVMMSNLALQETSPDWLPCLSIPDFDLKAKTNYFIQNEFADACTFLLFKFTADESNLTDTAITMNVCFKGKPANSKPKPKPQPDIFELVQGGTLDFTIDDLLVNDEYEIVIKDIKVDNAINGVITKTGKQIKFVHTGRFEEPASFTYQLIDEDDRLTFPCIVTLNITMLPEMKGYIFNTEELNEFIDNYTPPTFADIFNSWSRFYESFYYPSGTPPKGEAAAWQMISTNQFLCTVNSSYVTGFISPETFDYYEHQVDLSSTEVGDDDEIHLIIAFARIGNSNYSLLLNRECGGIPAHSDKTGFSILLAVNNTFTVIKSASGKKCWSGSPSANAAGYRWGYYSPTRVKVVRKGNIITCTSSPFKSDDLSSGESITIDLDDYPSLSWAKEKRAYGYSCYSQANSTFANVVFSGSGAIDANALYNLDDGNVYTYQDGKWTANGSKIWDIIGYPRIIENVVNGKRYLVEKDKLTQLE